MKISKVALIASTLALLSSCGAPTGGTIEVSRLEIVSTDGKTKVTAGYSSTYAEVFIYQNDSGDTLYVDRYYGIEDKTIKVYQSPYSQDYQYYDFVGLAGFLAEEIRVFVDLDHRVVDNQVKWLEYQSDKTPEGFDLTFQAKYTSKEVYEKVKKNGYYHLSYGDPITFGVTENGLELHHYFQYTEDLLLTYTLK